MVLVVTRVTPNTTYSGNNNGELLFFLDLSKILCSKDFGQVVILMRFYEVVMHGVVRRLLTYHHTNKQTNKMDKQSENNLSLNFVCGHNNNNNLL